MIKINRTTEYGLIALRHMSRRQEGVTSAREIADTYGLPFEITAKTLQRLKDTGLIQSAQGARGGYTLNRSLKEISLAEFLELMEGPQSVVSCASEESSEDELTTEKSCCEYHPKCEIRHLMNSLNSRIVKFLGQISLAEVTEVQLQASKSTPVLFERFVGGEP